MADLKALLAQKQTEQQGHIAQLQALDAEKIALVQEILRMEGELRLLAKLELDQPNALAEV